MHSPSIRDMPEAEFQATYSEQASARSGEKRGNWTISVSTNHTIMKKPAYSQRTTSGARHETDSLNRPQLNCAFYYYRLIFTEPKTVLVFVRPPLQMRRRCPALPSNWSVKMSVREDAAYWHSIFAIPRRKHLNLKSWLGIKSKLRTLKIVEKSEKYLFA